MSTSPSVACAAFGASTVQLPDHVTEPVSPSVAHPRRKWRTRACCARCFVGQTSWTLGEGMGCLRQNLFGLCSEVSDTLGLAITVQHHLFCGHKGSVHTKRLSRMTTRSPARGTRRDTGIRDASSRMGQAPCSQNPIQPAPNHRRVARR